MPAQPLPWATPRAARAAAVRIGGLQHRQTSSPSPQHPAPAPPPLPAPQPRALRSQSRRTPDSPQPLALAVQALVHPWPAAPTVRQHLPTWIGAAVHAALLARSVIVLASRPGDPTQAASRRSRPRCIPGRAESRVWGGCGCAPPWGCWSLRRPHHPACRPRTQGPPRTTCRCWTLGLERLPGAASACETAEWTRGARPRVRTLPIPLTSCTSWELLRQETVRTRRHILLAAPALRALLVSSMATKGSRAQCLQQTPYCEVRGVGP